MNADEIRKRREARGMNDPLNRLRAINAANLAAGAEPLIEVTPLQRLEELPLALRAENISWGELLELQSLADYIESGDVELAEAAGLDEQEFAKR